jgi:hypothetical protein
LGTLTLLLCAGAAASAGCPSTSNTGLLPITAVNIDLAQLLDGANLTCGLGPGQVYQYAAIVNYQPTKATNVGGQPNPFDCGTYAFVPPQEPPPPRLAGGGYPGVTTGPFANLPLRNDAGALPDGGSIAFTIQVYFFTNAAFLADAGPDASLAGQIANYVTPGIPPGATAPLTADNACGGLGKLPFSYATTCTAIEEDNIVVNAACGPVECNPASEFGCNALGDDSGADAGSLNAGAGDATPSDASAGADASRGSDGARDAPGGADGPGSHD